MSTGRRIRIGLVTSEFPPDLGGVETYAYQLAAELGRRAELEVTVYAPPSASRAAGLTNARVVPCLSSCRARDWSRLRDEPVDVWHALSAPHAWLALTGHPTLVSVHGNDFLAPYALTARPWLPSRLPASVQGWLWRRFKPYWRARTHSLIGHSLAQAARIFSNSHYTAAVLAREFPACAQNIGVAGVGVDARFFDTPRLPRGAGHSLLTVSRLSEPRKNVDLVLRALARLRPRFDFTYTVAGDGQQRGDLERLTAELGLADVVRFAGRVTDEQLRELYGTADLFVLTSAIIPGSHEGFGIVYLEAAAAGVPSLAARLAGAVEAVGEGQSGYFVDEPSVNSLETALARYLSGELRFTTESCREFARDFGWPRIADRMLPYYLAVMRT